MLRWVPHSKMSKRDSKYFRLEVIGKFPSKEECAKYNIEESAPVWLPADGQVFNQKIAKAIKSLSDWLSQDYTV